MGVECEQVLGFGSHGIVYKAKAMRNCESSVFAENTFVIKSFNESSRCAQEECNLHKILSIQNQNTYFVFPKIIHKSEDRKSLALSPEGAHFACTLSAIRTGLSKYSAKIPRVSGELLASSQTFCLLVRALRSLHDVGLAHRDIKLSNFFPVFGKNKKVRCYNAY